MKLRVGLGLRLVLSCILGCLLMTASVAFGTDNTCYFPKKTGMPVQVSAVVDVSKLRSLNYISDFRLAGDKAYSYRLKVVSKSELGDQVLYSKGIEDSDDKLEINIDELRAEYRVSEKNNYNYFFPRVSQTKEIKFVLIRTQMGSEDSTENYELVTLENTDPGRGGDVDQRYLNLADQAITFNNISLPHEPRTREASTTTCNCASDGICEGTEVFYKKALEDSSHTGTLFGHLVRKTGVQTLTSAIFKVRKVVDSDTVVVSPTNSLEPSYTMDVTELINYVPESDEKQFVYLPFHGDAGASAVDSLNSVVSGAAPRLEFLGKSSRGEFVLKSLQGFFLYSNSDANFVYENECTLVDSKQFCKDDLINAGQNNELKVLGSTKKVNADANTVVLLSAKNGDSAGNKISMVNSSFLSQQSVGVVEVNSRWIETNSDKDVQVLGTNRVDQFIISYVEDGSLRVFSTFDKSLISDDLCVDVNGAEACLNDELDFDFDQATIKFTGVNPDGTYNISMIGEGVSQDLTVDGSYTFDENRCFGTIGSFCTSGEVVVETNQSGLSRARILGLSSDQSKYVIATYKPGNRVTLQSVDPSYIAGSSSVCLEDGCPGKIVFQKGDFKVTVASQNASKDVYVFEYGLGNLKKVSAQLDFSGCKDALCVGQEVSNHSTSGVNKSKVLAFTQAGAALVLTNVDQLQQAFIQTVSDMSSIALLDGQCLENKKDVCVGKEVQESEQTVVYESVYANGRIIALIDGTRVELTTGVMYSGCDSFVCLGETVHVVEDLPTSTAVGKSVRYGVVAGGDNQGNYSVVFEVEGGENVVADVDGRLILKRTGCIDDVCGQSVSFEDVGTPIQVTGIGQNGTYVIKDSKDELFYGPNIQLKECVTVEDQHGREEFCVGDRVYNVKKQFRTSGLGLAHIVGFYGDDAEVKDNNSLNALVVYARGEDVVENGRVVREGFKGQLAVISKPKSVLMKNRGASEGTEAGTVVYKNDDIAMEVEFFGTAVVNNNPVFALLANKELELFNNKFLSDPSDCYDQEGKLCVGAEVMGLFHEKHGGAAFAHIVGMEELEDGKRFMIIHINSGPQQGELFEADLGDVQVIEQGCQIDVEGSCQEDAAPTGTGVIGDSLVPTPQDGVTARPN